MKKLYSYASWVLVLMLLVSNLWATTYRGYIITKDGKRLSGSINGDIFFSDYQSAITFTNDLGSTYRYQAELISGFVYQSGAQLIEYESKFREPSWCFLKVIHRGELVSLYKTPEKKTVYAMTDGGLKTYFSMSEEYWLQFNKERPFVVPRWGFRKKMRYQLRRFPTIANKIGEEGYRYKDLDIIVKEVNAIYRNNRRSL